MRPRRPKVAKLREWAGRPLGSVDILEPFRLALAPPASSSGGRVDGRARLGRLPGVYAKGRPTCSAGRPANRGRAFIGVLELKYVELLLLLRRLQKKPANTRT